MSDETSDADFDDLDPDTADALADAEQAMLQARAHLAEVPAEVIVTNHVMGLYELGAIHLSATPPDLVNAVLAIDAMACLVEGLGDRLGDDDPTMQDALANIRLAFVSIKSQLTCGGDGDAPERLNRPIGASRTRSSTTMTPSARRRLRCSSG